MAETVSSGAELVVRTDAECQLIIDGKTQGALSPGKSLQITLPAGVHRIEAVRPASGEKWQKTLALSDGQATQQALVIALLTSQAGQWIDPDTKLMWTAADNGSGLTWSQAIRYCRELRLGGFASWSLPSIDELQGIFKNIESKSTGIEVGYHVKGPLKLSGWQWSLTPGSQDGEGWALDFGDGGRASVAAGDSGLNRALCVRRGAE